jgi:hypothetical protein
MRSFKRDAKIEKVADGFLFTEGPVRDELGRSQYPNTPTLFPE